MAHLIEIPVEFRFEVVPAVWRMGIAKPVGWSGEIRGGPVLEIIEPAEYCGFQRSVSGKHLPQLSEQMNAYVKRYTRPLIWSPSSDEEAKSLSREIEQHFGHHRIELLLCVDPERVNALRFRALCKAMGLTPPDLPTKTERTDAWKLRDEFLRVKRNLGDLARFLNRWGAWSSESGLEWSSKPGGGPSFVFADSIWSDQDAFTTALRSDSATWLRCFPLRGFEARDKFPHFVRCISTCRDAIEATIAFDFVQGSKFRLCALKDCQVPFKLESGHRRSFCSQYHAHLASVRRNRKLSAKSKAPSTRH